MIQKLICTVLGIVFFIGPVGYVEGASPSPGVTLRELREYVARTIDAKSGTSLTDDELRTLVGSGIEWLKNAQSPTGRFRYEYIPYEDSYRSDDNIVRQTGALYAIGEVLKHDDDDPFRIAKTAERAIEHFTNISKEGSYNGKTFRCVTASGGSTKCDLGATALAVIGILEYIDAAHYNSSEFRPFLNDYTAFILAMQKENGGFQNTFLIGRASQSDAESPFSNGEALLALTRLYNFKADEAVKDAIEESLSYLIQQPYDTALYLWIMAAMKEIDTIDVRLQNTPYVRDFTLWRIDRAQANRDSQKNTCAYTEGVVSALSSLSGRIPESLYTRILTEAEHGLRKNNSLQITGSDTTRAFVGAGGVEVLTLPRPLRATGGFLTSEDMPTQRIDFTQHCVNAYLQMLTDVRGKKLSF